MCSSHLPSIAHDLEVVEGLEEEGVKGTPATAAEETKTSGCCLAASAPSAALVRFRAWLPGVRSLTDVDVDVAECCLQLYATGFQTLEVPLPKPIDATRACAVWRKRDARLDITAPLLVDVPFDKSAAAAGEKWGTWTGFDGRVLMLPGIFDPSHASSQAIMAWLRDVACPRGWLAGKRVLDYGCGSGILGFCALQGGAQSLVSVDLDRAALAATLAGARANGLQHRVDVMLPPAAGREGDFQDFFVDGFEESWYEAEKAANLGTSSEFASLGSAGEARFDCVIANMRKSALLRRAATLAACLAPGGCLVVSGFMADWEEPAVLTALRKAGLHCNVSLDALSVAERGDFKVHGGYGLLWCWNQ